MSGKKTKTEEPDILIKAIDTLVPDIVKKMILVSIGGVMLTEEAVRKILSELNLSKEIISLVVSQTNKAKDEVVKTVSEEFRHVIKKVNIKNELEKVLKDTKIKVQLEIDFESKNKNEASLIIEPKIKKKNHSKKTAAKK
jgi:DNA polymerase III delta prime subunit